MAGRWSWTSVGVAVAWLIAFAGVALWEVETARAFSLRGGQAGLPCPWTAAVVVIGGPLALLASSGCLVLALVGRSRAPGSAERVWAAALGPVLVVAGGLAVYSLLGLIVPGNRP
ncbi:MAG TPA: hypothetical protein VKE40_00240 [Gemmataceae bacterium]|nr:hypothetical protein [Gemmataceae bacterium]